MAAGTLRRVRHYLRRTPLHPQWLLGNNAATGQWVALSCAGRVLDIGCADRWIERTIPVGTQYIGVDYPVTGKLMYGAQPDIFADAAQLPLMDACADTVVMLEVIEHLRSPREALREAGRVLRPNGRLLLTAPFIYPIHDAPHDYQRLTMHGLIRDVEAAGLRVDALIPTLGSAETAGLIACLAIGGMALRSVQRRSVAMLLLPLLVATVPAVNLLAWLSGKMLPSWDAITAGYRLMATKP